MRTGCCSILLSRCFLPQPADGAGRPGNTVCSGISLEPRPEPARRRGKCILYHKLLNAAADGLQPLWLPTLFHGSCGSLPEGQSLVYRGWLQSIREGLAWQKG